MPIRATLSIVGLWIWDNSIFDGFTVPAGMDKTIAVNDILRKCGDLELIWPDWDFMKEAISDWSAKNALAWEKLYETTQFNYDPIANIDATIKIDRDGENGGTVTNLSETAAYNTANPLPDAKTTTTPDTNWEDHSTETRKGNIGVTATQDLIQKQRDIVNYNVYNVISDSFKHDFCLMVY